MNLRRYIFAVLAAGIVMGTTFHQPAKLPGITVRHAPARIVNDRGVLLPIEPTPSPRYVRSLVGNTVGLVGFRSMWGSSAIGTRLVDGEARYLSNVIIHAGLIGEEVECVDPATGALLTDYDEIEASDIDYPEHVIYRRYHQPAMVIGAFNARPDPQRRLAVIEVIGISPVWVDVYWPFPSPNVTKWLVPMGDSQ